MGPGSDSQLGPTLKQPQKLKQHGFDVGKPQDEPRRTNPEQCVKQQGSDLMGSSMVNSYNMEKRRAHPWPQRSAVTQTWPPTCGHIFLEQGPTKCEFDASGCLTA